MIIYHINVKELSTIITSLYNNLSLNEYINFNENWKKYWIFYNLQIRYYYWNKLLTL